MKKVITLLFASLAFCTANAQLLYKVSGKGLKAPSYIVGTHHLTNASFAPQINGLKEAMEQTKQVYGELPMDVMTNPDTMKVMTDAMMLPEGQTLKDILTPEQFEKLSSFCRINLGAGLDNSMVFAQLGRMTPAALNNQFTVLLYMKRHQGTFNVQNGIDAYFQQQALNAGKKVGGLETFGFQTSVLLNNTNMKRQVELLMCVIENDELYIDLAERLTNAYLAQDMDGMVAVSEEKLHNTCDSTPEEEKKLLYERNADWAKKMPAIMKDAPTLFAVGSLHIPGKKGIAELLRKAGYKVEAVK